MKPAIYAVCLSQLLTYLFYSFAMWDFFWLSHISEVSPSERVLLFWLHLCLSSAVIILLAMAMWEFYFKEK